MGRVPRILSESGIYHIMFRGTNKQPIFFNDRDYDKMLEILVDIKQSIPFDMYAYCLMNNHVHFVMKENENSDISKIMHRLLTKYARWFNIKYDRTGTLLEGRYRSRAVEDDEYFLHLIRYVHQNPLKASLVEKLGDYMWSSYPSYEKNEDNWVEKAFVREMLPGSQFFDFHNEEEPEKFELFDTTKKADEDILKILADYGIQQGNELLALKYTDFEKFSCIVKKLKSKFSERHIERVTGINRYKLKI